MKTKVLIVEDEQKLARSLALLLQRQGMEVWSAGDIDSAMALAAEVHPDVLVVDWMLKAHSDGLDLAECLRRGGLDCRVIVISGYPSTDLESRLAHLKVDGFLAKPFPPEDLLAMIQPR